jgi:hypothetical protein
MGALMTFLRMAALALALGIIPAAQAQAQTQDTLPLSTMTCKAFIESPKDAIGIILTWLIGFYHDENEPAAIDFTKMAEVGKKLGAYCAANPSHGLMTAAEKAME